MKLELADIATNEKHLLNGFKVLGLFPFYLRYIRVDTHIRLSKIREQIQQIKEDPSVDDFYNSEIQATAMPLIYNYCVTALVNNRILGWFFRFMLFRKVKTCSHSHILSLYIMVQKLDQPAFFLTYWKELNRNDNTLLSEEKQSSEKSSNTKQKQE